MRRWFVFVVVPDDAVQILNPKTWVVFTSETFRVLNFFHSTFISIHPMCETLQLRELVDQELYAAERNQRFLFSGIVSIGLSKSQEDFREFASV